MCSDPDTRGYIIFALVLVIVVPPVIGLWSALQLGTPAWSLLPVLCCVIYTVATRCDLGLEQNQAFDGGYKYGYSRPGEGLFFGDDVSEQWY